MRLPLAVATASFVAYFTLHASSLHYPRQPLGFSWRLSDDAVHLTRVDPGHPADRAGFRPGDRLVAGMGLQVQRPHDLRVLLTNLPTGVPVPWELERDGARVLTTTAPLSRRWSFTTFNVSVTLALGLSLVLGLLIGWRRPHDRLALLAAWLLAATGCTMAPLFQASWAVTWRALPWPAGALLWPAAVSSLFVPVLLFVFCARLPPPRLRGWPLALAITPGVLIGAYVTWIVALTVHWPGAAVAVPLPIWLVILGPSLTPLYFLAAVAILAIGMRRLDDLTERRRRRILLAGIGAGALGLAIIAGLIILQEMDVGWASALPALLFAVALFAAMPASFAYATLRYRLFDLDVIVRIGLQYALLRGMVLAAIPLMAVALLADLLRRGDAPLQAVLVERGWIYGVAVAAIAVVHWQRGPLMTTLDRRFFRERYVAQQVLRAVVTEIRGAAAIEEIGARVLGQIEAALHPRTAAILVREAGAPAFHVVGDRTASGRVPPLEVTSALVGIARALGRPLLLPAEGASLRRDLPGADLAWLTRADVEVLVPIALSGDGAESLLVLGRRRSEEPYANEDLDLLMAIAASLALIDDRAAPTKRQVHASRLGERYRLEHVLGEGGMGTVWAGVDEALDRQVAVKLLHPGGGDLIPRFRREAQAAARLSHPNIVTVHDFGVDGDGRPFLVMERLVGETLRQRLRRDRRLAADLLRHVVAGITAGLDAAHARGIVHRDLKPENVFLVAGGPLPIVKIVDFGIARTIDASVTGAATTSAAIAGTLAYMAPEQIAGGPATPQWDVWACAVVIYEMFAGTHPFATGADWLPALVAGRVTPVVAQVPEAPAAWQAFFDRALARDPAARPASAAALLALLPEQ